METIGTAKPQTPNPKPRAPNCSRCHLAARSTLAWRFTAMSGRTGSEEPWFIWYWALPKLGSFFRVLLQGCHTILGTPQGTRM